MFTFRGANFFGTLSGLGVYGHVVAVGGPQRQSAGLTLSDFLRCRPCT